MQRIIKIRPLLALMTGLILVTTFGCKKDLKVSDKPQNPYRKADPRSARDGVNDLLGYGYDVTGEYAHSSASKFGVINMAALQRDFPTRIEWDNARRQRGKLVSGEDLEKYIDKLKINLDGTFGFKIFGGKIKSSFRDDKTTESKLIYSSFDLLIEQKRGKMSGGIAFLKQYLHPSFLWDVQFESPEYIIQAYGTHVLTDITLGAKLGIMYRSKTWSSTRERASEIGIDVNSLKIFNMNVGLTYTYTSTETQNNFEQALHYETVGGDPSRSIIGDVPVGSTQVPTVDIANWQSSCTPANAEMIEFNPQAMIPIYEFIDDPVQKQAVINYIKLYLGLNQIVLERTYAKVERENPQFYQDSWLEGTSYDYYITFYDKDQVTRKTVADLAVSAQYVSQEIHTGAYQFYVPQNYRAVNTNRVYIGRSYGHTKAYQSGNEYNLWYQMMPSQDYDILQ